MSKITKQQMDNKLQTEKGWICNRNGNQYVYDFHLKHYPIIIKVGSTVRIDADRKANKGSNVIKIYAVKKESLKEDAKIICGIIKARTVATTKNWRKELEVQVFSVIESAKVVYDKRRRY